MSFEELAKQFAKKDLPDSQVELTGEIPEAELAVYRTQALAHISEHLEMPGFRPGKVPQDMVLKKVGEMAVLEEAVDLLVKDFYPTLVETLDLDVVGRPEIRITKLAPGSPAALSIRVAVYPEVNLPKNWKAIGKEISLEPALPATDEELEQTLTSLRQSRAKQPESPILDADGKPLPPPLPELNDEFAKSLGAFENLEALKEQIRKGITEEKARHARDARRGKIVDKLLEGTTVAVPAIFVESELEKIMAQMREDIARMGLKFEDYLTHANKTEEGVRNEFRDQATKRAKLQLTLNKVAGEEKLEADKTAVDAELKHAMEHFPDANPELVRIHIETVLRNEMALKSLEDAAS